jgi:hypothetical protein
MLVIVVAVFGICWLPLHVFAMLVDFYDDFLMFESEQEHMMVLIMFLCVHWLAMSNSFANPIIYGFTNDNFRVGNFFTLFLFFITNFKTVCFQNEINRRHRTACIRKIWKPIYFGNERERKNLERINDVFVNANKTQLSSIGLEIVHSLVSSG